MFAYRRLLHFEKNFILINFVIALILALVFFLAGIDRSSNEVCMYNVIVLVLLKDRRRLFEFRKHAGQ